MELRRENLENDRKARQRKGIRVRAGSEGGRKAEGEYWREGE